MIILKLVTSMDSNSEVLNKLSFCFILYNFPLRLEKILKTKQNLFTSLRHSQESQLYHHIPVYLTLSYTLKSTFFPFLEKEVILNHL